MGIFSTSINWLAGNSLGATFAKVALLTYTAKLIRENTADDQSSMQAENVRLQVNADIDNQIPILYGDAYFGGFITDFERSADVKTAYYVLTLAELTGNKLDASPSVYTFSDVYLDTAKVTFQADGFTVDKTIDLNGNEDESMKGLIKIYMYAGAPLQPDGFGGTTPGSYDVIPTWNIATHLMTGLMYAVIELTYNNAYNVSELPDITFDMKNSMSLPGDVLNDYMSNSVYGAGIPVTEINTTQLTNLNAYGTAGFTYTDIGLSPASGTIDINGLVDTEQKSITNMEDICRSVNAWLIYDMHLGQWGTRINEAGSSEISFDDSNIIGDITISGTSLLQLYNKADIRFQNTDILDKTDFVKIAIAGGDLFAYEPDTTMTINLPYTNKQVVATKVGLVALKQSRVDKVITFRTDYSYLSVDPGTIIDITNTVYGYTNKLFRIISVSESATASGIEVEFSCTEYDASVYTYNINEFAIETDDGQLQIGSIGTPNTPTITDNSESSLPHVIINAVVPSGIVDTMEFWITFDTLVILDIDRVYTKIGTRQNTDGSLYFENDAVTFRYGDLAQGDFFIKVRGQNNVNAGPFSLPSGLIQYVPVQVADQLSELPMDYLGLAMNLGASYLLNNIDTLFNGDDTISMEDAVTLKQIPGWDGTGSFADAVSSDAEFISKVGGAIGAAPTLIDELNDVDTTTVVPTLLDILQWDGANWVPAPEPSAGLSGFSGIRCLQVFNAGYADDDDFTGAIGSEANPRLDVDTPFTGDLEVRWYIDGTPLVGILKPGIGNAILYKSDGTPVEILAASALTYGSNNILLPFADRDPCTDYYIILDPGLVRYGEAVADQCDSYGICVPQEWSFTTILAKPVVPGDPPLISNPSPPGAPVGPGDAIDPPCKGFDRKLTLVVDYGYPVAEGDGIIRIKKDGVNEFAIPACEALYSGNIVTLPPVIADYGIVSPGYTVLPDQGAIIATSGNSSESPHLEESAAVTTPTQSAGPGDPVVDDPRSGANLIELIYDQEVAPGTGGSVRIVTKEGTLIETIPAGDAAIGYVNSGIQVLSLSVDNPDINRDVGQTDVLTDTNIKLIFDENIVPDAGNFYLYETGEGIIQIFDLFDYFVANKAEQTIIYNEDYIIINPTVCLNSNTAYHIRADANAVMGRCGNTFPGISDNTWEFTTATEVIPTMTVPAANNSPVSEGIGLNIPGLSEIKDEGLGDGPVTSGENLVGGTGQWQLIKDGTGVVETGFFNKTNRDGDRVVKLINSEK